MEFATTGLFALQHRVLAQLAPGHPQRILELGSVAAIDFEKIELLVGAQVVQLPDLPIGFVERLRRFHRPRSARHEADHLVFIFGQQRHGGRRSNSTAQIRSSVDRSARETIEVKIIAPMKNDAILMPSGRS